MGPLTNALHLTRKDIGLNLNPMRLLGISLPRVEARKRFNLSHAQIQMARELGMNPKKFGSLANSDQEPWKAPLRDFIGDLYQRHFRKAAPEVVRSIEDIVQAERTKKELRKGRKQAKAGEPEAKTSAED